MQRSMATALSTLGKRKRPLKIHILIAQIIIMGVMLMDL